jgi:hypothetical protein
MKIDGSGRIVDFAEKPKGAALDAMRVDTTVLGLDAKRWPPIAARTQWLRQMVLTGTVTCTPLQTAAFGTLDRAELLLTLPSFLGS